jgi:hypothetical protein
MAMKNWYVRPGPSFGRWLAVTAVAMGVGAVAAPASASPPSAATAQVRTNNNNPACESITPFDRKDFTDPTKINNRFLPFVPGTQYVLEGTATTGGGGATRKIVLTVTDLTKVINGVKTVVLLDKDFNDGELAEAELAFQAQDYGGRVWNMGEYPEVHENGKISAPAVWISGLDGAEAGQHMLKDPMVGIRTYLQGFAPKVDFLDCAKIKETGKKHVCVKAGCYDNVLVIKETSPPDPAAQLKYYAPGVGNIKVEPVNDPEAETLSLVSVTKLGPGGRSIIRGKACDLEANAYKLSSVYRKTKPMDCP